MRTSVAGALGAIGKSAIDAAPALIKTLQNPEVRWHAEEALTKIGNGAKDAAPVLIQALKDPEVRDSAAKVFKEDRHTKNTESSQGI